MKLFTTIIETDCSAGNMFYVVPTTHSGERQSGAKKGERRTQRQHAHGFMGDGKGRQHATQRDHAREQRKLQAEDDCVVLLCRD
ncbi:MAG TPA: hypothetical protein VKB53_05000 [Gammaproteobacteria bacterium]|nr:hypothetical protein [Gammaproteobacteria bacterium]HKH20244.1 hypothetical protein [Gammaproteobacteria bacterium]